MRAAAKRIFLSTFLILSTSVHAKPNLAATIAPIPDIEEMLDEAGWTMTPEMSAKFSRPGDILDARNTTLVDGPDCFEAEVKEGAFAKMEVTRSMSAGVRLRVKVVGAQGNVALEKKLIFDTPIYRQISRFKLVPTDQCVAFIRSAQQRGEDTSGWHVITESLSAIIQQQQCGKYDAKAGAFLVSTATDIVQACEQTSLEPVAVAYKTMPVRDILPLTPTTAANTATTVETQSQQRPEIELLTKAGTEVPLNIKNYRAWAAYRHGEKLSVPDFLYLADAVKRRDEMIAEIERLKKKARGGYVVSGAGVATMIAGIVGMATATNVDTYGTYNIVSLAGTTIAVGGLIGARFPASKARRLKSHAGFSLSVNEARKLANTANTRLNP